MSLMSSSYSHPLLCSCLGLFKVRNYHPHPPWHEVCQVNECNHECWLKGLEWKGMFALTYFLVILFPSQRGAGRTGVCWSDDGLCWQWSIDHISLALNLIRMSESWVMLLRKVWAFMAEWKINCNEIKCAWPCNTSDMLISYSLVRTVVVLVYFCCWFILLFWTLVPVVRNKHYWR